MVSVMGAAGLEPEGVVSWGELINTDEPGIYMVSTGANPEVVGHEHRPAPIDLEKIRTLLSVRPELTVDGVRPSADALTERLSEFWLPDENILYIGLATDLHDRVNQYYGTPLGARRPHAGGWFLKSLEGLDNTFVHWTCTYDRVAAEGGAIGAFVGAVSQESLRHLRDPERPFPFANLEWPPGTRKRHGIKGAKAPRVRVAGTESAARRGTTLRGTSVGRPEVVSAAASTSPANGSGRSATTQRVTAADISGGRIRIRDAAGSRAQTADVTP